MKHATHHPREINETDLVVAAHTRQRSARTDPVLRDGDGSHGSPSLEDEPGMRSTDNDVGDAAAETASEEFGVLDSLPGKADGGHAAPTLDADGVRAAADLPDDADSRDGTPPDHSQVQAGMNANADVDEGLRADKSAGRVATPPTAEADDLDSEEEGVVTEIQGHQVGDRDEALVEDGPTGSFPEQRRGAGADSRPADRGGLPMADYLDLTVPQIMEKIETMSRDDMRAVQRYEESHRRRKTLLVRLERRLRPPKAGAAHDANVRDDRSRPDGATPAGRVRHP